MENDEFNAENDAQEVVEVSGDQEEEPMSEDEEPLTPEVDHEPAEQVHFEDDSVQGFLEHREPVYCIDIHPTLANLIVTGAGDDRSVLWRSDTGEQVAELIKHQDSVSAVAFSRDGQFVASGGMDGKVHVFKAVSGQFIISLEGPSEVVCLNWHPKGNVLLCGSTDGTVWMWNIPSGNCMNVFSGHSDSVNYARFTNDGKLLISASEDCSVVVWDPKTANSIQKWPSFDKFHQEPIYIFDISENDQTILTGSADGTARLLHLTTGKVLAVFEHGGEVEAVAFCGNTSLSICATGDINGKINIWDLNTFRLRHSLQHQDAITKLKFHSASMVLFSASTDKTVCAWDSRTGERLKIWKGHQEPILDFVITPDGQKVITAGDDGVSLVFSF